MDNARIRCYISSEGEDSVCDWLAGEDDDVQGAFLATLIVLSARPYRQWPEVYFKELEDRAGSQCGGLGEIILDDSENGTIHCRILGFLGPRPSEFTMLYAFNKAGSHWYDEPCQIAQENKENVERNWNHSAICECAPPD